MIEKTRVHGKCLTRTEARTGMRSRARATGAHWQPVVKFWHCAERIHDVFMTLRHRDSRHDLRHQRFRKFLSAQFVDWREEHAMPERGQQHSVNILRY